MCLHRVNLTNYPPLNKKPTFIGGVDIFAKTCKRAKIKVDVRVCGFPPFILISHANLMWNS